MILAIDPSGDFTKGKGTTGFCTFNNPKIFYTDSLTATQFKTVQHYWEAVVAYLTDHLIRSPKQIIIEDYYLYAHKANAQINSTMETCQLIGILKYTCWEHNIPYTMQRAADVKSRWSDKILKAKGYDLAKVNKHERDALRHAVHYYTFKLKKGENKNE